jgi:hypothetical protein
MSRRIVRRLALAAVCLAALTACVVNLSFDLDQPGVQLVTAGPGAASTSTLVDLGNSNEVRAHRSDIRSLDLDLVDVTITEVKPDNQAQYLSGALTLRKDLGDPSTEVKVGDLQNFQVINNSVRHLKGNPAVDAFLLERLNDGGKFYAIVSGTTDGVTDIVLDILLHASMGYETGLF